MYLKWLRGFVLKWQGVLKLPVFALQEETESTDGKATEQMKKPKGPAPQIRQKPKKESKKKR